MARIRLRDDTCPPGRVGTRLDEDCGPSVIVDVMPRASILTREVIGHSAMGDRVMGWKTLASDLPVSLLRQDSEIVDGILLTRVKAIVHTTEPVPPTASLTFETGFDPEYDELTVYRITSATQNGFALEIVGERVIDG